MRREGRKDSIESIQTYVRRRRGRRTFASFKTAINQASQNFQDFQVVALTRRYNVARELS